MKIGMFICMAMLSFNMGATTNVFETFTNSEQISGSALYRQVGSIVRKLKKALQAEGLFKKSEFNRLKRFIQSGDIELAMRILANYQSKGAEGVLKAVNLLRRRLNALVGQNGGENRPGESEEDCPGSGLEQTEFFPNERAFAALRPNGMVITWGFSSYGGDSTDVADEISCGVIKVFSTKKAFAALKSDGSVVTWGNALFGGDSASVSFQLNGSVKNIFSTERAFVAVKEDDSLVVWGDRLYGGEAAVMKAVSTNKILSWRAFPLSSSLLDGTKGRVLKVASTTSAFAVVMQDKRDSTRKFVVTWGNFFKGGEPVVHDTIDNDNTFFDRYRSYGSDQFYGERALIIEIGPLLKSGVVDIFSTDGAFAALMDNGSVVTWGTGMAIEDNSYVYYGGSSHSVRDRLDGNVVKIFSNSTAFAALKEDGSVVTWGEQKYGGDSSSVSAHLASNVVDIVSNEEGFAAIKKDRSVIIWGGYSNQEFDRFFGAPEDVVKIVASSRSFAALERDGAVNSWGDILMQSMEQEVLGADVVDIVANDEAFAALKEDGGVVTWGWEVAGGDAFLYDDYFAAENAAYDAAYNAGEEPDPDRIKAQIAHHLYRIKSGVVKIASTKAAFVALKEDGSIVTWGDPGYGGDSSLVASLFGNGSN